MTYEHPQSRSEMNQVSRFSRGAQGNIDKMQILSFCAPRASFNDIAGYGDGSATKLSLHSVTFLPGYVSGGGIDSNCKCIRQVKHIELAGIATHNRGRHASKSRTDMRSFSTTWSPKPEA